MVFARGIIGIILLFGVLSIISLLLILPYTNYDTFKNNTTSYNNKDTMNVFNVCKRIEYSINEDPPLGDYIETTWSCNIVKENNEINNEMSKDNFSFTCLCTPKVKYNGILNLTIKVQHFNDNLNITIDVNLLPA